LASASAFWRASSALALAEAKARAEEARQKAEAEAKARAEEARQKAEAEAKRRAEEARQKAEAEAKARAEEARQKAEAEAKRRAEEARQKAEAEAKRRAEEARQKAEAEAKRRAEEARQKAEAEAKRKEEEARQKAEAETKRRAEEARQKAEAEAKRRAEEARQKAEAEAKRKEEEARQKAEAETKRRAEEARKKAEAEAKRKAEEARQKAEEEAKRKAEEARKKAEAEAKRKAEEARKKAEAEAKGKAEEARQKAEADAKAKAQEKAERLEQEIDELSKLEFFAESKASEEQEAILNAMAASKAKVAEETDEEEAHEPSTLPEFLNQTEAGVPPVVARHNGLQGEEGEGISLEERHDAELSQMEKQLKELEELDDLRRAGELNTSFASLGDPTDSLADKFEMLGEIEDEEFVSLMVKLKGKRDKKIMRWLSRERELETDAMEHFQALHRKEQRYFGNLSELNEAQEGWYYIRNVNEGMPLPNFIRKYKLDRKRSLSKFSSRELEWLITIVESVQDLPIPHGNMKPDNIFVVKKGWGGDRPIRVNFSGWSGRNVQAADDIEILHENLDTMLAPGVYKEIRNTLKF
ncbi:MAG: hypothetical protein AAFP92_31430, partial [Bacteroidota bacterium]